MNWLKITILRVFIYVVLPLAVGLATNSISDVMRDASHANDFSNAYESGSFSSE